MNRGRGGDDLFDFPLYDWLLKIGVVLVILSFGVGFFGTQYDGIAFSLHYYQYLYVLVIAFAGIRYGLLGGFLTAAALSALHIIGLNFNEAYYRAQNVRVHYNFQIILFALVGLATGYGYELMAQKVSNLEKGFRATVRSRNQSKGEESETKEIVERLKSDVHVKNLNVLFKFTKNLLSLDTIDSFFEAFMSIMALDYNTREIVVFRREDRELTGQYSKGWTGEKSMSELVIPLGEHLPGKAVASGQFLNLDPPDPDAEWMMAIPIFVGTKCTHCIAVARWKSLKKMDPEEIQNILRMSTILGNYIEALHKVRKKSKGN